MKKKELRAKKKDWYIYNSLESHKKPTHPARFKKETFRHRNITSFLMDTQIHTQYSLSMFHSSFLRIIFLFGK